MKPPSLRRKLFWTLFLTALIPAAGALLVGTFLLRETVATTGSAGPWIAVAESGRELLDVMADSDPDARMAEAAARHRSVLSESARLAQMYSLVGERIVFLVPAGGLVLLLFVAGLAVLATRRLAGSLAAPVEELADWIRRLGRGEALPARDAPSRATDVVEFQALRTGLRDAAVQLEEARQREIREARARSWTNMARRVAHEIKNPLTPMRMAAERVSRSPDPETAEAGEVLLEEIGRLDGLARSFSQFGRPVEGPRSQVDLAELLRQLRRRLRVEGAPVEVEVPSHPVVVRGHLEALERVVRNLVSNALEAQELPGASRPSIRIPTRDDSASPPSPADGPEGSPVRIRLEENEDEVVLTVEDRGPGIPHELLDQIWEPDFTTRRRGTGLGLPLVRQAVRSHGGRVQARNRPDGGARFQVVLPLAPEGDTVEGGVA